MSRRTIAVYFKAGKLTTRTLALALRAAGRQIRKAHQAHQTPHGRQTVRKLMAHGANTNSAPVEAPALFDRVARKMNVDYAFYKTKEGEIPAVLQIRPGGRHFRLFLGVFPSGAAPGKIPQDAHHGAVKKRPGAGAAAAPA